MLCVMAAIDPRLKRIRVALAVSGKSERWLSVLAGLSHTAVGKILSGETRNPREETIARLLRVVEEHLEVWKQVALEPRGFVRIPVYPGIAAGAPGYDESDVFYEDIPAWGGERVRWGRVVSGDSMMPVFRPGDIVILEDRMPVPGLVVQAYRDGEDVLKCWREVHGRQELWSFNDDYLPLDAGGWAVKGVAVGRIRSGANRTRLFLDAPSGITWNDRQSDF